MKLVKVRWYDLDGRKHETWEFPEHDLQSAHDRDLEVADFELPGSWEKGFDRVDRPHLYGKHGIGEIATDADGDACIEYEGSDGETRRIKLERSAS